MRGERRHQLTGEAERERQAGKDEHEERVPQEARRTRGCSARAGAVASRYLAFFLHFGGVIVE